MAVELYPGEELVTRTRRHARLLLKPVLSLFVISAAVGALFALVEPRFGIRGEQIAAVVAGIAIAVLVIVPILRWLLTSITLTTQRLIVKIGILRREEHQVMLSRIIDVTTRRHPTDLGFGSGTLILTTVGGQQLALRQLPRVKAMQQAVSELAAAAEQSSAFDAGVWEGLDEQMGGDGQMDRSAAQTTAIFAWPRSCEEPASSDSLEEQEESWR